MEDLYKEIADIESRVPNLGLSGVMDAVTEMKDELKRYEENSHLILL